MLPVLADFGSDRNTSTVAQSSIPPLHVGTLLMDLENNSHPNGWRGPCLEPLFRLAEIWVP